VLRKNEVRGKIEKRIRRMQFTLGKDQRINRKGRPKRK
jgi:hypothetical protein